MYYFEMNRSKRPCSIIPKHKVSSVSHCPIQLKKLKDCTYDEIVPYQPLLWSREKFNAFLYFFRDREIGNPTYSEEILNLIQEFDTPQIIQGFARTANFREASGLPQSFFFVPRTVENMIFRVNDLFHLQLGFRSIAV